MAKQTYPWVVATADTHEHPHSFLCLRCGAHEEFPVPIPLHAFCAWGDSFGRRHRGCKEKALGKETE